MRKEVIGDCTLYMGDCVDVMREMADASVDSIVTDPPYELGFMGKAWDASGIAYNVDLWRECLRVLKPGGHLLAFSGSRTYHRMTCAIEDAGFEIRDQIMWLYGSGFPKSLDVSKAIDKAAGAEREVIGHDAAKAAKQTAKQGTEAYGDFAGNCGVITAPATDAARQWQGWGTALKPAHEPIVVARKPLVGTVAANVLAHGTGGLNIDGCRVTDGTETGGAKPEYKANYGNAVFGNGMGGGAWENTKGRWPANVIHDGSDEVLALFPQTAGQQAAVGPQHGAKNSVNAYGDYGPRDHFAPRGDSGSAARFFYCAKASKADRDEGMDGEPDRILAMSNQAKAELARGNLHVGNSGVNTAKVRKNNHPTVKPTDLMRHLCRLVTPPGGVVLDPFTGSGSTGKAAMLEGFRFIGIEREAEYVEIARARIAAAMAIPVQESFL